MVCRRDPSELLPTMLPADSAWHHAVFQLTPGTMIALGDPAAFCSFFSNAETEFRIIHEFGATDLKSSLRGHRPSQCGMFYKLHSVA